MAFWPTVEHWSVRIPFHTPHPRLGELAKTGLVMLSDDLPRVEAGQYRGLTYLDWKSGGETKFAPLASADGQLDTRGFWDTGRPDKDGIWTSNVEKAPGFRTYVEQIGANFGRVRVFRLEPQDRDQALRSVHRNDNNRFNPNDKGWVVRLYTHLTNNPGSYLLTLESGPDGTPDPTTERRVPLHLGARYVIDDQRLWNVIVHRGPEPLYALVAPRLDKGPSSQAKQQSPAGRFRV